MQMLQAEVSRLHMRLESCLKERGHSVSSSATMVHENHHPRTSPPRVRLVVFPLMWAVERMYVALTGTLPPPHSRTVNTDGGAAVRKRPCCGQRHSPDVCK